MNARQRLDFDRQLQAVLDRLPSAARKLLDDLPLIVEDHPSRKVMREQEIEFRDDLCGLHSGIPLSERSIEGSAGPNVILIYREGILQSARESTPEGATDADLQAALRKQIRITVLHELGHHVGLDEDDLEQLGYG